MLNYWRRMSLNDINEVSRIAAQIHPSFPEERRVFVERQTLAPNGCFVLELSNRVCGYLISHPWSAGDAPALNTLLEALPSKPQTWYLHDLALTSEAQGKGFATSIIHHLFDITTKAHLPSVSLVAVNNSYLFWHRLGFVDNSTVELQLKLRSYDEEARYMVRNVSYNQHISS